VKQTLIQRFATWLARVTAIDVGKANDGLVALPSGTLDRAWSEISAQLTDVLDVWRKNPLARRIIGLTTAYVIGDGITLATKYGPLNRYLTTWWNDDKNLLDLELGPWCDELSRAGELFISLHLNTINGISYARPIPAAAIDAIETQPGDLRTELSYHETVSPDDPDYLNNGRTWYNPQHTDADAPSATGHRPIMIHFAVNRPVGCVRGDSDLAAILPYLTSYGNWLRDRVFLNAAIRKFLWIVKVPKNTIPQRKAELRQEPPPGSVLVVDKDAESWEAVAPTLHAQDAEKDGRAIRWMIAAGGPGLALTDFGEAETANLATASAMGDQRTRFLKARQAYFGYILARLGLESYNRAVRMSLVRGKPATLKDILIGYSDVSSTDNGMLATAAAQIANALKTIFDMGVNGSAFQRLALRIIMRFAGERLTESDLDHYLPADTTTPEVNHD